MNATTCFELGRYVYAITKECSAQKPDPEGNFDEEQKERHIYKCNSEHPLFDSNEENVKCVSV